MRLRIGIASLVAFAIVGLSAPRTTAAPSVKWAAINLKNTVSIAGKFVSGPVLFVHDDAKMARGEPCTGVYRFVPGQGAGEELVSFHCTPRWGTAPSAFTQSATRRPDGPPVMTEYQFAGDEEAHLIPAR